MQCSSEAQVLAWGRLLQPSPGKQDSSDGVSPHTVPHHCARTGNGPSCEGDFPGGDTSALGMVLEACLPTPYEDPLEKQLLFPSELALKD